MANDSWYRRATWTEDDRSEFFARFGRSRSNSNKAQYCRIQAVHLEESGHYRAAIELLEMARTKWPDPTFLAQSWSQQAKCFELLDDQDRAVEAYQNALEAQRRIPNVLTQAHREFGWLVAMSPLPALYDEALSAIDEFSKPTFPIERFKDAVICALIWEAKGDHDLSSRSAIAALKAAREQHSGFARHAKLGLVENLDDKLKQRLEAIAQSGLTD